MTAESIRMKLRPPPPPATPQPEPPRGAERFVGRLVSFDLRPDLRATGYVIAAREDGVRGPGAIPDFILTIRGASGRCAQASIYDHRVSFAD